MNFILNLLLTGVVAYILQNVLPGVHIKSIGTAIGFALILALLNAVLRPVLLILSLPINILTLGLFSLVINALITLLAANMFSGMTIDGFWWALLFSILLSFVSGALSSLLLS